MQQVTFLPPLLFQFLQLSLLLQFQHSLIDARPMWWIWQSLQIWLNRHSMVVKTYSSVKQFRNPLNPAILQLASNYNFVPHCTQCLWTPSKMHTFDCLWLLSLYLRRCLWQIPTVKQCSWPPTFVDRWNGLSSTDHIKQSIYWSVCWTDNRNCWTLKNCNVLPPNTAPYLILFCLAKSSALLILSSIRSLVRKAAKLAVYDEMTISAKNHHKPVVKRVDIAL